MTTSNPGSSPFAGADSDILYYDGYMYYTSWTGRNSRNYGIWGMELPFADARDYKVFYNGHELSPDELDGYTVTKYNNWVYVDIHIPADKICPFAIAMVKYECTVPKVGIMEF